MTNIRTSVDGFPDDRVGHELISPGHIALYREAGEALADFKVPVLVHADNAHEKLYVVAFDGTGNNKFVKPLHATNVAKISDQIIPDQRGQVHARYIEGPGTQAHRIERWGDSLTGHSYESNIEKAYDDLVVKANEWRLKNPAAVVRVHSIGFSRGASQVPAFARLVHENGIPDLSSRVSAADGTIGYDRYIAPPGKVVQAVGLFDPVATGAPMNFDRRLPPSVVSGLQITAADERRMTFPSDQIILPGRSADGRFLNIMVPGAHSDVGGGYLRNGASTICGNLMRDYCNALRDEPYLQREPVPTDQRMNVIHHSNKGVDVFRFDPREATRGEPSGTNERLAPRHIEHAGPAPHGPLPADPMLLKGLAYVDGSPGVDIVEPSRTAASPEAVRAAGVPRPVGRYALYGANGLASGVDAYLTYKAAEAAKDDGNITARDSLIVRAASRNAAGIAGAQSLMSAGAALGIESGPGMFVTGAIGGVAGFVAGDKIADAYDQYRIRNQDDSHGNTWHHDDRQGWTIDVPPLPDHPRGQRLVADAALSSQLSYQASNTAVELALGNEYPARDPFVQPASPTDTPSLRESPWTHQAQTHQWTRQVTDQRLEHGMTRSHVEVANPQRAAELNRLAESTIQQNIAESSLGVAQRYQLAYEREGWDRHGPMPEAVAHAVARPADQILASDGHTYTHGRDREWSRDTLLGSRSADESLREELDASERVAQGLKKGVDTAALDHPHVAPALPTRLDDPNHPDHALFKEIRGHVVELDKGLNRSPDHHTDNIASALTVQARADGLSHVDRIALSADGQTMWASQTPAGRKDHVFDLTTKVPTAEASTPMEQSGAKWPEAMQQFQGHEQELAQTQQRSLERAQAESQAQSMSGPVMKL